MRKVKRMSRKETGRKKGFLQMAIIAGIGAFIGGGGSILTMCFQEAIEDFLKTAGGMLQTYIGTVLCLLSVCAMILGSILVRKLRNRYEKWDGEDEVYAEKLEKSFCRYQTILTFLLILNVCLSGIIVPHIAPGTLPATMVYVVSIFWGLFCIDKIVRYDKKMNPEKRGNYLSWSFNKEWLASCDEREKERLFQAAYHTCETSQFIYLGIWIALNLLSAVKDVGVMPFLILAVIWCSQILLNLYYYEHKTEK